MKVAQMFFKGSLLSTLVLLAVGSCGERQPNEPQPSQAAQVRAELPAEILTLAWGKDHLMAGIIDARSGVTLAEITDDGDLLPLGLPSESRKCARFDYIYPMFSDSGQLLSIVSCTRRVRVGPVKQIAEVDPRSGSWRPLFASRWADITFRRFGLAPDGLSAVASEGNIICNSLVLISDVGWSRPTVVPAELVPIQGQTGAEISSGASSCDGLAKAESPDISSQGTLAFISSLAAADTSGMGRLESPGTLYLQQPGDVSVTALVDGVSQADLQWSPDGSRLAVVGIIDGEPGLFVVDASSGDVIRLSDQPYHAVSWDPKGESVVVARSASSDWTETVVEVLRVP